MSRDWVIEKMTINVTYDSDVELARQLIKKVGQELAADPEFAADTLQPLKMQGVDSFGDFAIVLRLKLTTKPNTQFAIKRRAFMMIKKAFDENGIKIAVPTVHVEGERRVCRRCPPASAVHENGSDCRGGRGGRGLIHDGFGERREDNLVAAPCRERLDRSGGETGGYRRSREPVKAQAEGAGSDELEQLVRTQELPPLILVDRTFFALLLQPVCFRAVIAFDNWTPWVPSWPLGFHRGP